MNKLKILWKSKKTFATCFYSWKFLMFPYLYLEPNEDGEIKYVPEYHDWYLKSFFWSALNNYNKVNLK